MSIQRPVDVVLIGALLLSMGCTSMRPVRVATPAEPTYGQVQPGDTVMVRTPDGERWRSGGADRRRHNYRARRDAIPARESR